MVHRWRAISIQYKLVRYAKNGVPQEHIGPLIITKIQIYILTRAELLYTLCYEIPYTWQTRHQHQSLEVERESPSMSIKTWQKFWNKCQFSEEPDNWLQWWSFEDKSRDIHKECSKQFKWNLNRLTHTVFP